MSGYKIPNELLMKTVLYSLSAIILSVISICKCHRKRSQIVARDCCFEILTKGQLEM